MNTAELQETTGTAPEAPGQDREQLFGRFLMDAGKLPAESLERALRLQSEQAQPERLGTILVKLGLIAERDLAEALARQLGLPLADKGEFPEALDLDADIAAGFLRERKVLPFAEDEERVRVAMADPLDDYALEALRLATGRAIVPYIGLASEIDLALEARYGTAREGAGREAGADAGYRDDVEHLKEMASEAPIIKMVNLLLHGAVEAGASDIHIEPFESRLKVRYRIDGMLREAESSSAHESAAVISRVKIMANLNIAERRLPQDGRFKMRVRGRDIDLRISTTPTLYGESVVMRILHRDDIALDFPTLGFRGALERDMLDLLALPHGILLVTGPTGSGKTTTLYAALRHLNTPERKIITVEDPVEYNLDGVNQIQVKPQIGLTFAGALRSIVRQDPDVVMIGEMRDQETARIAVQSALTGHLVLSTLHTNDAAGSVTRMLDMGVEDYLLTSTVNGVLAQRLARTLCHHCREPYAAPPELIERWQLQRYAPEADQTLYRAVGCPHCGGTGYAGRTTILELLKMTDPVRRLVLEHADAGRLAKTAQDEGMRSMFQDGMLKVAEGQTTIEEVLRVTQEA